MSKRHFIIIEVETETEQAPKAVEDAVAKHLRALATPGGGGFKFKSVGWIADNVRPAPTGKQEV